jgi:hypothetical protein
MPQHPAAGVGTPSVSFQPRIPLRGHDREGAKNYSELLEQRPVLETLEIVERHFRSIVTDHEL